MANRKTKAKSETVRIDGSMTIYEVADIHKRILRSLGKKDQIAIDLQGVTECDTSGIQLLYSAYKTGREKGLNISFINISDAIGNAADQIGLEIAPGGDIQGG